MTGGSPHALKCADWIGKHRNDLAVLYVDHYEKIMMQCYGMEGDFNPYTDVPPFGIWAGIMYDKGIEDGLDMDRPVHEIISQAHDKEEERFDNLMNEANQIKDSAELDS